MSTPGNHPPSAHPAARWHRPAALLLCAVWGLIGAGPLEAAKKQRPVEEPRTQPEAGGGAAGAQVVVTETVVRESLPDTFFGFNMNFHGFQEAYMRDGRVQEDVLKYLRALPGTVYRFPGGLVANTYDWEGSLGAVDQRRPQRTFDRAAAERAALGPEEYLRFVNDVKGRSWFVLNLVGWGASERQELDVQQVAQSNQRLAVFRKQKDTSPIARYYQLGNELDRSEYQWPPEKYIERARASVDAIRKVDPEARFVPFLRDFDWRYRGRPGISLADDFARQVMQALPTDDYSLNTYYDSPREGRRTDVANRVNMIRKVIATVNSVSGRKPGLWITEHARQLPEDKKSGGVSDTSGIDGAISSADFIMAMAPMNEVRGMFWHAVGGGKWSLFTSNGQRIEPTPAYWMMRLLRENSDGRLMETTTTSSNVSGYEGGYDTRTLAFKSADGKTLTLWAVNRSSGDMPLTLTHRPFADRNMTVSLGYAKASSAVQLGQWFQIETSLAPVPKAVRFGSDAVWTGTLPPRSISVVRFKTAE